MNIALSLIPLLMQELPGVISAWNSTSVNDHYSTYLNNLAPAVGKFIKDIGTQLFPTAAPEMQVIGGAFMAFNTDYTRMLQGQINNLIGPLALGIQPLTVDGIYGTHTRDGVIALQRHFGITLDGVAGNITQGWIGWALAKLPQVK